MEVKPRSQEIGSEQVDMGRATGQVILVFLVAYKVIFYFTCFLILELLPIENRAFELVPWPSNKANTWIQSFAAWDGANYLLISRDGYTKDSPLCAFYPLWPLCIRLGSHLTGGDLFWSAMLLTNVFSVAGLYLLHSLIRELLGERSALWAVLFSVALPGSLFYSFPYTESLFLLVLMVFFLGILRRRAGWVLISALLLPLVKAVGVFCIVPLGIEIARRNLRGARIALVFCPIGGFLIYLSVMHYFTGNPFEGFEAQQLYPNRPSIGKLLEPIRFVWVFLDVRELHGLLHSLVDRLHFVLFLILLPRLWRVSIPLGGFGLFVGGIPAVSTWLLSYSRNIISALVIPVAAASMCSESQCNIVPVLFLGVAVAVQFCFLAMFLNCYWVA